MFVLSEGGTYSLSAKAKGVNVVMLLKKGDMLGLKNHVTSSNISSTQKTDICAGGEQGYY